jgi:hypothetical protein
MADSESIYLLYNLRSCRLPASDDSEVFQAQQTLLEAWSIVGRFNSLRTRIEHQQQQLLALRQQRMQLQTSSSIFCLCCCQASDLRDTCLLQQQCSAVQQGLASKHFLSTAKAMQLPPCLLFPSTAPTGLFRGSRNLAL